MLQSEYDAITGQKRLKVLLIILTTIVVAVVLFVVIRAGRENMPVSERAVVVPRDDMTPPSPEEIQKRLDELSKTQDGKTPPPPSPEEIQKRLDELSKTQDGKTPPPPSPEEIQKRLNELSKKK